MPAYVIELVPLASQTRRSWAIEKSFAMMSNEIKGLRQDTVNGQEQLSNIKIFTERGQIAAGFDPGFGSRNL